MSRCGAVWVQLGERPADDRLWRCDRAACREHPTQLAWVRQDPRRWAAYRALAAALARQQQAPAAEQAALL
jgi:hypothetical protein